MELDWTNDNDGKDEMIQDRAGRTDSARKVWYPATISAQTQLTKNHTLCMVPNEQTLILDQQPIKRQPW